MAGKNIFWPQIWDGKADAGPTAKLYNVQGTPDLWVIDRRGKIAARLHSTKMLEEQLAEVSATDIFPPRTRRDTWQRPVRVMEELGIRPGSVVADVGAGGGYFTFRLAARVGPQGKVYAQDVDEKTLAQLRLQAEKEKLSQVVTVQGTEQDPKLPESALDAVLVVDAFHEFPDQQAMATGLFRSLKLGGRLGVIDNSAPLGLKPAEYSERHNLPHELLIGKLARAGFRLAVYHADFVSPPGGTRSYLAVFEKPRASQQSKGFTTGGGNRALQAAQ